MGAGTTLENLLHLIRKHDFTPEEVNEISVAYENTCLAVEGASPTPEIKAYVAGEIVRMARAGLVNSTDLYLNCLEHCRSKTNIAIMKKAM
jgi:hypothetical protein